MFRTITSRLIVIGVLVGLSVFALIPRNVKIRERGPDGRMRDTTVRRVPLKKGLDLQGGIHLALEVDQSKGVVANPSEAIDRALTVIRTRVDEFGVAEPLVQKVGDSRIVVELAGIDDPARAKRIVERSAFLEWRITDMQNRFSDALSSVDRALIASGVKAPNAADTTPQNPSVLQGLLSDTAKADSTAKDTSFAVDRPGPLSSLLFRDPGMVPGEFLVREEQYPLADSLIHLPAVQQSLPRGLELFWGSEPDTRGATAYRPLYALDSRPVLTGDQLQDARATIDPTNNQAIVTFELTRTGGRIFRTQTRQHVNDYMAIMLDQRVFRQPPIIKSEIGRSGQIELGSASLQEAQDLALVLKAGALPVPLKIVEERTVGPSLGRDSIQRGIRAGWVAAVAVVLLVLLYYRFSGILAVTALAFYGLFTLGGLALFDATLTLPGLAGFALSVGMAVDANVLIFERIREELAQNKTIRLAIDAGFQRAMSAIVDSNITTVLTALFLFQFGTGPVRGFAVTLIIGILASFVTAVFITRTLFLVWMELRPAAKELSI